MGTVERIQPVAVIRAQFTPTLYVEKALAKFTTLPAPHFTMYASGERVVDLAEYHRSTYQLEIERVKRRLYELGKTGLALSDSVKIAMSSTGNAKLYFQPLEQQRLDEMVAELSAIPTLAPSVRKHHFLYVDISRSALVKNHQQIFDAGQEFSVKARHPSMKRFYTVNMPTVVENDVPHYRLPPFAISDE